MLYTPARSRDCIGAPLAIEETSRSFHHDPQMLGIAHALPIKLHQDCGNPRGLFRGLIDARLFYNDIENRLTYRKIVRVERLRFSNIDRFHVVQKPAPSDGAGSSLPSG